MTAPAPPHIFLSYARADGQAAADKLGAHLANPALTAGLPLAVWQDLTSMRSGQWREQIRAAIRTGDHLLMVLSPEALKSEVCAWEWHVARLEGAEISPVLADPAYDLANLPKWMKAQHIYRIDLTAPSLAESPEWHRLVTSLRAAPGASRMTTISRMPGARFVPRPAETNALRDMLLDARGDAVGITTAFTGSGGMGKTTLALALAQDQRIQSAFYGGQLLIELGQQPNLLLVLRTALHDLTGENSDAETVKQATEQLVSELAGRRVLLVIDDVWQGFHLEPFMQGGPNCARLVTTRDEGVLAKHRGALAPVTVDQMSQEQAVALLGVGLVAADIAARRAFLVSLANRLGRCALLLELANGRIWTWAHDRGGLDGAVDEAEIEFRFKGVTAFDTEDRAPVDLSNPATRNEAYADSIAASLALLSDEHKTRFLELAIFPEDTDIPYASIALYWAETAGMDERATFNLLDRLKRMSLVKGALVKDVDPATRAETPRPAIRLHDVIRSYARDPARTKPEALSDLNHRFWKAHVDAGTRALREKHLSSELGALNFGARPSGSVLVLFAAEDRQIANCLSAVLANRGYRPFLCEQRTSIGDSYSEAFESHIQHSDSVIFIMSPELLSSQHIVRQVERAEQLDKRIIPIVWRWFHGIAPPPGLARRNWLFFDDFFRAPFNPKGFVQTADSIVHAVGYDLDWIRAYTRHVARAQRWQRGGQLADELLLSGAELDAAQAWSANIPTGESVPDSVFAYLEASHAKFARDRDALEAENGSSKARALQNDPPSCATGEDGKTGPLLARSLPTTKAFISYAREDAAFGHALDVALTARGIRVLIDLSAIAPAEEFEKRLDAMILEAHAVVFLMSPDALASRYCQWEVARAEELQKRIVPVVWRDFDDTGYRPPEGLRKRNWIFFDAFERLGPGASIDGPVFAEPFDKVIAAITIDIDWQRAHTRHIARAELWHARERPEADFLLSSAEINDAQSWANRKPASESIPAVFFDHLDTSLAKAARDLEELNARERRISARTQQLVAMEAQRALGAGLHGRAMRLALAGEPTPAELSRGVTPEPLLRAVLAAAAQASPCSLSLPHPAGVWSAIFTSDGARGITACHDGNVRIWDVASGSEIACLPHPAHVNQMALAEAAGLIATACCDGHARLWRTDASEAPLLLPHADEVRCVAFSPDARLVASGSMDMFVIVWDSTTGALVTRLKHGEDVHAVCFSPDGHFLLSAASDRAARLWSTATWAEVQLLPHDGRVYAANFSPDGTRIVTASEDGTGGIWDAATGARVATLKHQYPVNAACFSPDGTQVATASMDRSARLWDATSGEQLQLLGHDAEIRSVCFSPDGRLLATASSDSTTRLWDVASGRRIATFRHDNVVTGATFNKAGGQLLTTSLDRTARVWQVIHGAPITQSPVKSTGPEHRAVEEWFSKDGSLELDVPDDADNTAIVKRASDSAELFKLRHADRIRTAAFSPNGQVIATGGDDEQVRLWSAESGREMHVLRHDGAVYQVVFSADGARLLTVTKVYEYNGEDIARLWDAKTGTLLMTLPPGNVRHANFGADGASIVTFCDDDIARTWDATFTLGLRDEALVRAAARDRLRGEGLFTDAELLILRPILGDDVERDVVARWRAK